MTALRKENIAHVAALVARDLASSESSGMESAMVQMPLLYPSGSSVVVRIDIMDTDYFVSDMGLGLQEAEMMGAPRTFKNSAVHIAENAGIQFDQHSFFVARASREQLVGAVTTIANCSLEATIVTAHKIAEDKADNAVEILQQKLTDIFTAKSVARDVEIRGASATAWKVAASVRVGDHYSLFDFVSPHPNSVAAAVTKFVDISELQNPPKRVAVVRDKSRLGTRLTVLARTANVIEVTAPERVFRNLALAA
jgi:hypothetical protein